MKTSRMNLAAMGLGMLLGSAGFAEQSASTPSLPPTARAEAFLARVLKGEIDPAVDELAKGSVLQEKVTELSALKGQIRTVLSLYGVTLATELVREIKTKDSIVHLVYLGKQEHVPLTWHFFFYKPKSEWLLMGVSVNDRMQGLEQ